MRHEQRVARAYNRELAVALAVYGALLCAAIVFARPMQDGLARTLFLASPMLGFGLMIRAIARHLRRIDEYARQCALEVIALSAAITAAITFTYGFLETAGFPRLSMFAVWMIMGGSALAVVLWRKVLNR